MGTEDYNFQFHQENENIHINKERAVRGKQQIQEAAPMKWFSHKEAKLQN